MVLPNNAVHVWYLNDQEVNCPFLLRQYYSLLSPDEKEKLEKLSIPKKKHQFLIVRAVTRSLLSLYLNVNAKTLKFCTNENGKPYLINNETEDKFFFNISHTEKMIVWAISRNREVGVDVEYTSKKRNVLEIAQNYFSTQEWRDLKILPTTERNEKFFELWTLKEAYVKAHGRSITSQMKNDSFFDSTQCQFWHIQPNATHKIAIVVL